MTDSGVYGEALLVEGLTVTYEDRVVLQSFDMRLSVGEVVAIMGPSGSGKSTLLGCIAGLQLPNAGSITVGGHAMTGLPPSRRARLRRELIGLTLQSPDLLPELSVEENVAITLLFDGVERASALELARRSLAAVGLEGHGTKRTDEISGGEAQRVSTARALVRPTVNVLIADEPTASLDAANAESIAQLIVTRARDRGIGAVVATHDERVAAHCDRVISLRHEARV